MDFKNFNPIRFHEWKTQAIKDLKGMSYDEKLLWETFHGINGEAYYNNENSIQLDIPIWNTNNKWNIAQHFKIENEKASNEIILKALNNGIEKICVEIINENVDFEVLFNDVLLPYIYIEIKAVKNILLIAESFIKYAQSKNYLLENLEGCFNYDILQYCIANGDFHDIAPFVEMEALIQKTYKYLPKFSCISVQFDYYAACGASCIQELAYGLAHFHEYIHRMSNLGLDPEKIVRKISFYISIGEDYFIEIAKIRALRYLMQNILRNYSLENISINIHAICSSNTLSNFDTYNNVLRLTTQAMSAILGGVNSCEIPNFSLQTNTDFTNRISANIQHILRDESNLEQAMNAAEGSYYIDYLCTEIVKKSWEKFVDIENIGGYLYAIKNNIIQDEIEHQQSELSNIINSNKKWKLGVNKFTNANDKKITFEAEIKKANGVFCNPLQPFNPYASIELERNNSI